MKRPASSGKLGISLFPFLDALICMMGGLIVILAAVNHSAAHQAKELHSADRAAQVPSQVLAAKLQRKPAPPAPQEQPVEDQSAKILDALTDARDELAWRLDHLRSSREKTAHDLQYERLRLSSAENQVIQLKNNCRTQQRAATNPGHLVGSRSITRPACSNARSGTAATRSGQTTARQGSSRSRESQTVVRRRPVRRPEPHQTPPDLHRVHRRKNHHPTRGDHHPATRSSWPAGPRQSAGVDDPRDPRRSARELGRPEFPRRRTLSAVPGPSQRHRCLLRSARSNGLVGSRDRLSSHRTRLAADLPAGGSQPRPARQPGTRRCAAALRVAGSTEPRTGQA
jgi:hypothetical protein